MKDVIICDICGKKCSKYGIKNHIAIVHEHKKNRIPISPIKKGNIPWNKGLNKNTDIRVLNNSKKIAENEKIKNGTFKGKRHSEKTKRELSEHAIRNELGGHTSKKCIYYKKKDGIIVYLQSSWEEKLAILFDDMKVQWHRPKYIIWKDKNGTSHRYYADFYLPDYNLYFDPKNSFLRHKDKNKIECVEKQNNVKIIVLDLSDITKSNILRILNFTS